ncbi:hypothetical protein ACI2L4_23660 [Streptomyces sparsogenes]|uniref:hypothetical protein n=1 Tax=Streptomyces sparsogenes TaxID=67365 RepID=UPI0033F9B863
MPRHRLCGPLGVAPHHRVPVPRALRAAVFAAVCVLLAGLGHALMSRAAVPWWVSAAAVPVTGAPDRCLAGRERGTLTVIAATVAAQTALHVAFTLAQGPSPPCSTTRPGRPAARWPRPV